MVLSTLELVKNLKAMNIYNEVRFIDLNALLNKAALSISIKLDEYSLNGKPLVDKDVSKFVYHSFINVIFNELDSYHDFYKNCIYIDKSVVKDMVYLQLFDAVEFCKFYKKFVKDIKTKIGMRLITNYCSLDRFISSLVKNNSKTHDIINEMLKRDFNSQSKIIKFLKKSGLQHNQERFNSNLKLKMYISA
jgi:hypothetical protein